MTLVLLSKNVSGARVCRDLCVFCTGEVELDKGVEQKGPYPPQKQLQSPDRDARAGSPGVCMCRRDNGRMENEVLLFFSLSSDD